MGRTTDPTARVPVEELSGPRGRFVHEGLSFYYPEAWELVEPGAYYGPGGNYLWDAAIGEDERNFMHIFAVYYPSGRGPREMRRSTRSIAESAVAPQHAQVLRPPKRVRTAGVIAHWTDVAGHTPSGPSLLRIFVFDWNDVEYSISCKEHLEDGIDIIRGCDTVMSTLRLGVY